MKNANPLALGSVSLSKCSLLLGVATLCGLPMSATKLSAQEPNVVFITIDDLSRADIGAHGSTVPDITPNMDLIASGGLIFSHAHVTAANCTPSRNTLSTGLYPHNNDIFRVSNEGSGNHEDIPVIADAFKSAGYHVGIMGKNSHQSPVHPHPVWEGVNEYDSYGSTRDSENIYTKTSQAFADAKSSGKPLFFNLNIYDPHVKWHNWDHKNQVPETQSYPMPSREYDTTEVPYPSWFPALSEAEQTGPTGYTVMDEVAAYYSSVKRADDSVGRALDAITDAGEMENTIIVLMTDHGVELPGVKTMLYHHSTASPLFVIWPGVTTANTVNSTHVVNSTDIFPTFCEMIGEPIPEGLDGRSIVPIIQGQSVSNWPSYVYKQHNQGHPSRAVQTTQYLYIFNPWSDGVNKPTSVSKGHLGWEAIEAAGMSGNNPEAEAWRVKFEYRTVEELYDISTDPDCKHNLIEDGAYATVANDMRDLMANEMIASEDYAIYEAFRNRTDPVALANYYNAAEAESSAFANDASRTRDVFFNPLDDSVIIDHTIFEPAGDWGIWTPETSGIVDYDISGQSGFVKGYGSNYIQFNSDVRLVTNKQIDLSGLSELRFDAIIIGDSNLDSNATLTLQYDAGSGWQSLGVITAAEMTGENVLSIPNIPNGLVDFGILAADLGGGSILLDAVRFGGWEAWQAVSSDDFESSLGNWILGGNEASWNNTAKLHGSGAIELSGDSGVGSAISAGGIDGSTLGVVRIAFDFLAEGVAETDQLILEYFDGSEWSIVDQLQFDHNNENGYIYTTSYDLHDDIYTFTSGFDLRLRAELSSGSVYLDGIVVATRNNRLGSGETYFVAEPDARPIPEVRFFEDFESGDFIDQSWTVESSTAQVLTGAPSYAGSYGARLKKGGRIVSPVIDLTDYESIQVAYAREAFEMLDPEYFLAEWSMDGSSWTALELLDMIATSTAYESVEFDIPSVADGSASFQIRFTCVGNLNVEKVHLDNVQVKASPISTAPMNAAPVATSDSASVDGNSSVIIDVLSNDTDADGDSLSLVSVGQGVLGSVVDNGDGTVTYTPAINADGLDSFTYTVSDGIDTDSATVSVTIHEVITQPTELLNEDFESGSLSSAWAVSSATKAEVVTGAAYNGSGFGLRVKRGAWATVTVDTMSLTSVELSYVRKASLLDAPEHFTLEWSADGSSWTAVETVHTSDWTPSSVALPGADNTPNLQIRFSVNSNKNTEQILVDDIVITAQ